MLKQIQITNFRSIKHLTINEVDEKINIILGKNGAGKTSILEAIYIAFVGKSFLSKMEHAINLEADEFVIFAEIMNAKQLNQIGIRKTHQQNTFAKLNAENVQALSDIAKISPIKLINFQTMELLSGSPKYRRNFLDFALFHMEPNFSTLNKDFNKILQQKNALLKQQNLPQLAIWNKLFIEKVAQITYLREAYLLKWVPLFQEVLQEFLPNFQTQIQLYAGFDKSKSLEEAIKKYQERELQSGYAIFGSQRADLRIKINNQDAAEFLSRGQQKLVVCAMQIAQGKLLNQENKKCVYLLDDLPAELDEYKRELLFSYLQKLDCQIFLTATSIDLLPKNINNKRLFYMEQGKIL